MNQEKEKAGLICSRDILDGAYPSLILGINAARQGMESKIFYTFMGLNLVAKGGVDRAKFIPAGLMGSVPGMSSMATAMMKKKIDKARIPSLGELMEMAQLEGPADPQQTGRCDLLPTGRLQGVQNVDRTGSRPFSAGQSRKISSDS